MFNEFLRKIYFFKGNNAYEIELKSKVDMTARLFEGNNVDREFLVYRTVIQVNDYFLII